MNTKIAEAAKVLAGELLDKEPLPHNAIVLRTGNGLKFITLLFEGEWVDVPVNYHVSIHQQSVTIYKEGDDNDKMIAALKNKDYIVMKKEDILGKLQA